MIRIRDLSLPAREDGPQALRRAAARALGVDAGAFTAFTVRRRSVDARKKADVRVIYTVDVSLDGGEDAVLRRAGGRVSPAPAESYAPPRAAKRPDSRPVIVGFGPAGMFTGLTLAMAGVPPLILERGQAVEGRAGSVERFWETGQLDPDSNVQFGEGGAGAFSDGKLNTGVKNPRVQWILDRFVEFGARENVAFDAKPHVGTDRLRVVVKNLRERVVALGGEVRFGARVTDLILRHGRVAGVVVNGGEAIACDTVILAPGHSARDTFQRLHDLQIPMEPKPFAMGVRIEHRQRDIDRAQYGAFAGLKALGAADYKLAVHTAAGDVYTFCMCPGGYVVGAASEPGGVVTNGMSYSGRGGENANAALLAGLAPADFPYAGALGGMEWQRELERRAFEAAGGGYLAPAMTVGDFLSAPGGHRFAPTVTPTCRPGVTYVDLGRVLPERIAAPLRLALPELGRRLAGFDAPGAVLTAPETRSSSPLRIPRNAARQALPGLYPCGEGPGHAGGITSAALDGILTAEAVVAQAGER